MKPTERWLPVVGFEDLYEVSEYGKVRSLPRKVRNAYASWIRPPQPFKTYPTGKNRTYVAINLVPHEGRKRRTHVHVLVLEAFVGTRPDGYDACHNDGNPGNNHVSNLRWDTKSANGYDRVKHGNHHYAKRDRCKRDHPLDGIMRWPDGSFRQRYCKTCWNARMRAKYHRQRAEKTA